MAETLPHPFGEEIKGIAAVSGIPLGKRIPFSSRRRLLFFFNRPPPGGVTSDRVF